MSRASGAGAVTAPRSPWRIALAGTLLAGLMLMAPLAAASGSGYSLSFTASAGAASPNVALVSLSTSASGSTVTVTAQVAGQFITNNALYTYGFFFGGTAEANASAYVLLSDAAQLTYASTQGGYQFGSLAYTLSSGNSVMTFAINQSAVGPSSSFSANAVAAYGSNSTASGSVLGSDYPNGGISCNGGGSICTSGTSTSSGPSVLVYALVAVVVVIVLVVIVVFVVMRRKKTPPATPMAAPPAGGMPPAPPAGSAPPPPAQ